MHMHNNFPYLHQAAMPEMISHFHFRKTAVYFNFLTQE